MWYLLWRTTLRFPLWPTLRGTRCSPPYEVATCLVNLHVWLTILGDTSSKCILGKWEKDHMLYEVTLRPTRRCDHVVVASNHLCGAVVALIGHTTARLRFTKSFPKTKWIRIWESNFTFSLKACLSFHLCFLSQIQSSNFPFDLHGILDFCLDEL